MVHQPCNTEALFGIFGQASQDEVFDLQRGGLAAGEVYVVIDDLAQIFFRPDLEGHFAVEQLVGEHSDVPDVHLAVVLLLLHQLRRRVNRRPAERVPEKRRVDRPSKVADLGDALHFMRVTSWKRMFSGLRSRCRMSLSCMNSTA